MERDKGRSEKKGMSGEKRRRILPVLIVLLIGVAAAAYFLIMAGNAAGKRGEDQQETSVQTENAYAVAARGQPDVAFPEENTDIYYHDLKSYMTGNGCCIETNGEEQAHSSFTNSPFIPVVKGDNVRISGFRAGKDQNVLSFYTKDKNYISGIAGQGARNGIYRICTCEEDGYIRLCSRSDLMEGISASLESGNYSRLTDLAVLLAAGVQNTDLSAIYSVNNEYADATGKIKTSESMKRSELFRVQAGWKINVEGARARENVALLAFYSDKSSFCESVAGSGTKADRPFIYECPEDGYIILSTHISTAPVVYIGDSDRGNLRNQKYDMIKYISPDGDDAGSGSREAPLATVGKAISENATTIYLLPGTYSESVSCHDLEIEIVGCPGEVRFENTFLQFVNCTVKLGNIAVYYSEKTEGILGGIVLRDCNGRLTDCHVSRAPQMGFSLNGSKVILERCTAEECGIDGFNAHDTENISEGTFIGCTARRCLDDGLSYHENGRIHVEGGEYAFNISTGIAPHNNCSCDIRNAYIHGNGAGIEAYNTPYTEGISSVPTCILSGNIIMDNNLPGHTENDVGYGVHAKNYQVIEAGNAFAGNGKGDIYGEDSVIQTVPIRTAED